MLANILAATVLLSTASLLIFGLFGFPALGVRGFGYASALQSWFYFLFTLGCFYTMADFKKFTPFQLRLHQNWYSLKALFKMGWPISLQISGEMLSLTILTSFIGWLGINALAAYQMMSQYQFLVLVPIFAISQASGILLGQAYGRGHFTEMRALGQTSLKIAALFSLVMGIFLIGCPTLLASVYIDTQDPANYSLLQQATLFFAVMAVSQFADSQRNVLIGSLRGLLDTRTPMIVGLLSIWLISLPMAYFLAFTLEWGPIGVGLGGLLGMIIGACALYYRWWHLTHTLRSRDIIDQPCLQ